MHGQQNVKITLLHQVGISSYFIIVITFVNLFGSQNEQCYFMYLRYGSTISLMMTLPVSKNVATCIIDGIQLCFDWNIF